jgi:hypothetical protein
MIHRIQSPTLKLQDLFPSLQNAFFGVVSENLCLKFRVAALHNILRQDGAYFDDARSAPGTLITRLAKDASSIKAVHKYLQLIIFSHYMF